jgi:hypothetical protein
MNAMFMLGFYRAQDREVNAQFAAAIADCLGTYFVNAR